ncbi:MAG: hypothetical protein OXE86_08625 [Alphaproteobacteria bacterium]|nr:hypothetical protein [Alphaproteobacteria bacterium]
MAADPVPAVAESEATGEIAEIYADIRSALGIGVVNLIWRHLATIDGALPWAWQAVRPLYAGGAAAAAGNALLGDLELPDLPPWPASALQAAGVDEGDLPTVRAILDSYNRGNATNLVALSTLVAGPAETPPTGGTSPLQPILPPGTISTAIPPLPALDALAPETRELVMALSGLAAGPQDRIVPSLYRHLADWPGYLALAWAALAPLDRAGRLRTMGDRALGQAAWRARRLDAAAAERPQNDAAISAAIEEFRRSAISRMVPIAMILRCLTR